MLYVNNPEYVLSADLADSTHGSKEIFKYNIGAGRYRCWAQHNNQVGSTIGAGVMLSNPGTQGVNVTIEGKSAGVYGNEFRDMFNTRKDSIFLLQPGSAAWLINRNSIGANRFFGYVVDFEVGDSCIAHALIYKEISDIAAKREYVGYITREWGNSHRESRVYKGWNRNCEAIAELKYQLDSSTPDGILPVRWQKFDTLTQSFGPATTVTGGWTTNISVGHNLLATMSDMLSFLDPSWKYPFEPGRRSDFLNMYPNFGNWSVLYRHQITITNRKSTDCEISFCLNGSGPAIAYQDTAGVWRQKSFGNEFVIYTKVIAANSTASFDCKWVLGGPASGNIRQYVRVRDLGMATSASMRQRAKARQGNAIGIEVNGGKQLEGMKIRHENRIFDIGGRLDDSNP